MQDKKADLVCQGGGVLGIALVGAIAKLEEEGYQFQNIAGTSAGAIVGALLAAGFNSEELNKKISQMNFPAIKDKSWEDRIFGIGLPLSIIKDLGIYEGNYFRKLIEGWLAEKGVYTFKDLVHPDFAGDPRYRYRLQVVVSDITSHELLLLPHDSYKLGISNSDDLNVALAIRMSMSIPIFFEPVKFRNPQTGEIHVLVDGGLLSNFPVWVFDTQEEPPWPTFGLMLVDKINRDTAFPFPLPPTKDPRNPIEFIKSIVSTAMEAHDRMYLEDDTFIRTITIPNLDVSSTNFDITQDKIQSLYKSGYEAAGLFLSTWDMQRYKETYRSNNPRVSRRISLNG
jgi:NTE family protein